MVFIPKNATDNSSFLVGINYCFLHFLCCLAHLSTDTSFWHCLQGWKWEDHGQEKERVWNICSAERNACYEFKGEWDDRYSHLRRRFREVCKTTIIALCRLERWDGHNEVCAMQVELLMQKVEIARVENERLKGIVSDLEWRPLK